MSAALPPLSYKDSSSHRFHLLDALRGIAAIAIVPRHVMGQLPALFPMHNTFLAVDFFFCLSGFVVAFSYEQRLETKLTFKDFFAARIIRLYPLLLTGILIDVVRSVFFSHDACSRGPIQLFLAIITNILLIPSVISRLCTYDGVKWSLVCEFAANASYGVMVRTGRASKSLLASIALISFSALVGYSALRHTLDVGYFPNWTGFILGFARVGCSFGIGVLIYRLNRALKIERLQGVKAILMSLACFILFGCAMFSGLSWFTSLPFQLFAIAVVFPLVTLLGAQVRVSRPVNTVCSFLGDMSYPLYLLHIPLLGPVTLAILSYKHHGEFRERDSVICLLVMICAAWCFHRLYDTPIRRHLVRAYKSRSLRQAQT